MATSYQSGQTPTFLARIVNIEYNSESNGSGPGSGSGSGDETLVPITQSQIASINYTITKKAMSYGSSSQVVTGHDNVSIDKTIAIQEELITEDENWTADTAGYNFKFAPDSRTNKAFPSAGTYVIEFEITLAIPDGVTPGASNPYNPIVWKRTLTFV